jgi:hypothetical protein
MQDLGHNQCDPLGMRASAVFQSWSGARGGHEFGLQDLNMRATDVSNLRTRYVAASPEYLRSTEGYAISGTDPDLVQYDLQLDRVLPLLDREREAELGRAVLRASPHVGAIMDPISAAIIAAVTAGLAKGVGDIAQGVLVDGYQGLKNLLARRFGNRSDVVQAVESLEARPDSAARRDLVVEEVQRSGAGNDKELLTAARDLLARIQEDPGLGSSVQQAIGSYIAQADRQSHAEVNVNTRDK